MITNNRSDATLARKQLQVGKTKPSQKQIMTCRERHKSFTNTPFTLPSTTTTHFASHQDLNQNQRILFHRSTPPAPVPTPRQKLAHMIPPTRLGASQQVARAPIACSLVILLAYYSSLASTQQPQYSRQGSHIYQQQQQQQQQPGQQLVINLQVANYQNDHPLGARHQKAAAIGDQDNVIESTTSAAAAAANTWPNFIPASPLYPRDPVEQQSQISPSTCQLPLTWAGKWYQLNKDTIRVTNSEISDKGVCRDRKGDKFLFESAPKPHQAPCLVCLVINERHLNVLQYKESTCQPLPAHYLNRSTTSLDNDHSLLDQICSDITGDAQLESMFRLDTPATECPISGKFHFTYDNCREPLSQLDSCLDKKQLKFQYSACQDVGESKTEVLKCYADWSEGNNYYMIGRLEEASNQRDKGKFRCFLYEKSADGKHIKVAQSLEESCYELINASDGPKTLELSARPPAQTKCHFPNYIQQQSDSWLSVDNLLVYMFNANSSKYQVKETREGNVIEEVACLEQVRRPFNLQQARSNQQVGDVAASSQSNSRRYPPSSNHFNRIDQTQQVGGSAQSSSSSRHTINDSVYLVQLSKNCFTADYCVRFHRRTSGIVQIDYFETVAGAADAQQRCRNAFSGTQPTTQMIASTNLEYQRCPLEGAYTIDAPPETDFSYNPSNIFICPRQSFLTAQCDNPTRLRIHYKCSPAKQMVKNLHCQGSWTTDGLVRLILVDDERQRYSAWYRDHSAGLLSTPNGATDFEPNQALSRSQQMLAASPQAVNSLSSVVDLQIALITAPPGTTKPWPVRLTRRSHCSELRGYTSQGSLSAMVGSPVPNYASPSASSASSINSINSINSSIPPRLRWTRGAATWPSLILVSSLVITLLQAILQQTRSQLLPNVHSLL